MNCQHGICDYTARHWITKGGRAMKVCNTCLIDLKLKGWVLR